MRQRGWRQRLGTRFLASMFPEGPRINPQAAFAVVQVCSDQFKVSPGDIIYTEKLKYADINDKLLLSKMLFMRLLEKTMIGRPTIPEEGILAAEDRVELARLRIVQIEGIEAPAFVTNGEAQLEENPV